jgi:pSer/pThr/pTyr-binding forkhead associated (FHA) protein
MGSRNGTLVNGKALTAPATLKHGDLVQVGPLTFSVAVEGGPATEPEAGAPTVAGSGLMPDPDAPARDLPGGVHGGSTMMIPAFKNTPAPPRAKAKAKTKTPPAPVKPADKGETDAASDILSKMMTRRREPKS